MIKFAEASRRRLPTLLIVLMVLQPLLDIVSYFWSLGGHSNLPTLLLDEISEAAIKGQLTGVNALAVLAKADELTHGLDAHDQARAKLHKAIGWAAMGKTGTKDLSADEIKALELDKVHIAHQHLQRAMALNDKAGVKKDVERMERRLKELQPAAPN